MAGQTYPLAANFTAPIALALAELKPRKKELGGLFKPDEFATGARLARLQPYDPKKIPILCIHGLGDSQATWAPMIESLRADPVIRPNYQVWFFSYASGNPYPCERRDPAEADGCHQRPLPRSQENRRHRPQHGRHDQPHADDGQRHEALECHL